MKKKSTEITDEQIMAYVDKKSLASPPWILGGTETTLRQIEMLTNAWDTISNMWIKDTKLSEKQGILLDRLTEKILNEVDSYLKKDKAG